MQPSRLRTGLSPWARVFNSKATGAVILVLVTLGPSGFDITISAESEQENSLVDFPNGHEEKLQLS